MTTKTKRKETIAGPAIALLCMFISGCVGTSSTLGIVNDQTNQAVSTPQASISDTGAEDVGNLAGSPTSQFANVPQQSPLKIVQPAAAEIQNAPTPALAIASTNGTAEPAVAEIASVTSTNATTESRTATATTQQVSTIVSNESTTAPEADTSSDNTAAVVAALPAQEPDIKKPNLLQRLFGGRNKKKTSAPSQIDDRLSQEPSSRTRVTNFRGDDELNGRFANSTITPRPKVKVKNVSSEANLQARLDNAGNANTLPGVKSNNELFGIEQSANKNANSGNTQLASLGNFGRLSPNGLRLQHDKVQVACLKPGVLKIIKMVERRYGKKPIITSGYRSPKRNRRAGGARNSQHVFCKAVDMQVEGVSKWQLAKYLRTIPGRGGVGTYCRTKSVHIDIGSKRDWHHPCRRSAKRKRKKA